MGSVVLADEILFATLLGFILFQETLTIQEIIGSGLIGLAMIIPKLKKSKKANKEE